MWWTKEKLKARVQELSPYRYRDRREIREFRWQLDPEGRVGARPPKNGEWQTIRLGDRWEGRDLYAWLQADVALPAEWAGKQVLGLFDFGRTGGGHNSGFESLLFIDGVPYQGVDSNHQEVFFAPESIGRTISLAFRLWSGLEGGGPPQVQEHRLVQAELAWLDPVVDDLYFWSRAIVETLDVLDQNQPEYHELLQALDGALQQLDWSKPGSEGFYASTEVALATLKEHLSRLPKNHPVVINCVGHTHIDVAWLWRLKHTREKTARSMATVLRLMELYPEYIFMLAQPQLYAYIKQDYPELYEQLRERVREGRWEVDGGMWLEADCNLPSGESLVRQLLHGTRFFRDEFGLRCSYLWLPDVFGYSWALPQILKKADINSFITTKISWNQYNRLPHDTFRWRGIDGSEVLTYFITTPRVRGAHRYIYEGDISPVGIVGSWENYQDKVLNQELLLSYGYGDGGGGVNRTMLEMRRRLADMPGLPQVHTSRVDDFLRGLHGRLADSDQYLHTWDGELYLEYHRGTYTSQAYNKRMNRKLELLYRETEWLNALRCVSSSSWKDYPQAQLQEGWRILLRQQFHDIIPGSSITEVYEDSHLEYEEANQLAQSAWQAAAQTLAPAGKGRSVTVFNSSPWERTDLVQLPCADYPAAGTWVGPEGEKLTAQHSQDGWLVRVKVPAMGYAVIHWEPQIPAESENPLPFSCEKNGITTPYYSIEWNEQGQLTKLYDLEQQRSVLAENARGNLLQVHEDKPLRFDAWDIDIFYKQKYREINELLSVEVVEVGDLRAVVRFTWRYQNSTIKQDLIVYAHHRRIDFVTEVDWHEQQQLLKVAFPVEVRATEATYDIQFGNVRRPTHWNTSWDYARFEVVGHQWADLSETGYGVSLLNDCKYGYDIKDNVMRLSLIKSGIYPDPHADQGLHHFTYSLLPHTGGWIEGQTVQAAWALNNPLSYTAGQAARPVWSMFQISRENVMIDAVKKAEDEDRLILRVHEYTGQRGPVEIGSQLPIRAWQECNLLEEPCGELQEEPVLRFELKPYEIKTFLLDLGSQ